MEEKVKKVYVVGGATNYASWIKNHKLVDDLTLLVFVLKIKHSGSVPNRMFSSGRLLGIYLLNHLKC